MQQKRKLSEDRSVTVIDSRLDDTGDLGKSVSVDSGAGNEAQVPTDEEVKDWVEAQFGGFNDSTVRERVLDDARSAIMGDRDHAYGSPEHSFTHIAELATTQFRELLRDGVHFDAHHVAQFMVLLKLARIAADPKKLDSWVDGAGYMACGAEAADAA